MPLIRKPKEPSYEQKPKSRLIKRVKVIDPRPRHGYTPVKGVDYFDGETPTDEQLIALIKPLIPKAENGKDGITPTIDELLALIRPLIPQVQNGETPSDERLISLIKPLIPKYTQITTDDVINDINSKKDIINIQTIKGLSQEIDNRIPKQMIGSPRIKMFNNGKEMSSPLGSLNLKGATITNKDQDYTIEIQPSTTGVQSVVAGTNISVDNTDPQNPIVSSTSTIPNLQQVTDVGSSTTNAITVLKTSLGTTTTNGFLGSNTTPATSGNQQVSPAYVRTGQGWKTTSTAASQSVSFRDYVLPVQGTTNPSLIFKNQFSINNGSWNDAYSYDTTAGGSGFTFNTPQAQSNSTPGTARLVSFNNTGLYTWLDFNFSGTRKSSIGSNSSGEVYVDATAGNGLIVRISGFPYHYLSVVGLLTNGYGAFSNGVMAGGTTSPTSTLVSTGGTALKVKRITASATLDNTATKWLLDATNASACTGTPTYQCSDYNNETDCIADSNHGGNCNWFGGNDCSVYNYEYGMYGCASQSGCSVDTTSCSGAGDSFSCYAQNDSYGGNCAWNGTPNDCSVFTDETSCLAESGCGWDGASCSGTYYTYSCDGTYNTGTCSGFYGATCSGSIVTCGQYSNSTDCGLESGCTWSSVLNANLPNIDTCLDRDYWLYNDSSTGADSVIIPYSGQTIDNTSSYTLANYKDGIHISPYTTYGDCSVFGDETTCLSYSGCGWDGSACSGTYVVSKNWFIWSRT